MLKQDGMTNSCEGMKVGKTAANYAYVHFLWAYVRLVPWMIYNLRQT